MPQRTESGITVHLPEDQWFRLHDWPTYKEKGGLSHFHFKEMDFGWYESASGHIYLAELKDFSRETDYESKVKEMVKKAIDSLFMLHAAWCGMQGGADLLNFLPSPFRQRKPLRLYFIIKAHPAWKEDLGPINDLFQKHFGAYQKLLDIDSAIVLSHGLARQLLPDRIS